MPKPFTCLQSHLRVYSDVGVVSFPTASANLNIVSWKSIGPGTNTALIVGLVMGR